MELNVIVFGQIADITGTNNFTIENIEDTDSLITKLKTDYPALSAAKYALAVDKKIIKENTSLKNGNTVALLPPFSGG